MILLGLRIAAVALLYLFLFWAFLALRRELSATRTPSAEPLSETPPQPDAEQMWATPPQPDSQPLPVPPPQPYTQPRWVPPPQPYARPNREAAPRPARQGGGIPAGAAMFFAAAAMVIVLGGGALFAIGDTLRSRGNVPSGSGNVAGGPAAPFGPATVTPAPGRVTVGLAATTDAQVRVTVDGTVQFQGTLAAGERQAWDGRQRIQVWTDSGRTLLLAVNGQDLGPYSPAMGHPDWNRIDFGFWPGWTR